MIHSIFPADYTIDPADIARKHADIAASFHRQQENPLQRALFDGFTIAFSMVERCGDNLERLNQELGIMLQDWLDKTTATTCQGLVAGILFCDRRYDAGYPMLLDCLTQAFDIVEKQMTEKYQHKQHYHKEMRAAG